ncbi:MAG: hypothetical protein ACR2G2_05470 [Pseudonocardia sp.]
MDLFLGHRTRDHEDLEIVVLNEDVPAVLSAFTEPEWRWVVPMDGWLHPLTSAAFAQTHQTWLWSDRAQGFVLDVFRDKHDGDTWICRRDETIRRSWHSAALAPPAGRPTWHRRLFCSSRPSTLVRRMSLIFKPRCPRSTMTAESGCVLPCNVCTPDTPGSEPSNGGSRPCDPVGEQYAPRLRGRASTHHSGRQACPRT